jgi:hypothetical protein
MSGPDKLLLVEDCLSALQIQSALYRAAAARGESGRDSDSYGWVAALADVVDGDVVRAIHRTPILCYSSTAEGRARVEALREHVTLRAFAGPADGTIGEAAVSQTDERGVSDLSQKIFNAALFTRPFRAVREEVDGDRWREVSKTPSFVIHRSAATIIGRDLSERGRLSRWPVRLRPAGRYQRGDSI